MSRYGLQKQAVSIRIIFSSMFLSAVGTDKEKLFRMKFSEKLRQKLARSQANCVENTVFLISISFERSQHTVQHGVPKLS